MRPLALLLLSQPKVVRRATLMHVVSHVCFVQESTGERLRVLSVLLPDTQMGRILLENFTQQFSTRTGIQLSLKFWDVDTIQKELLSSIQSQTSAI